MKDAGMSGKVNDKKTIFGWAIFDWANSAYALVISTAVFPPYFSSMSPDKMSLFGQGIDSNALYSFSISFSFLLVAIMTPFLSGIADHSGRRATFLKFFTLLGALACMSMYFFDSPQMSWAGLIGFVLGTVGFGGGIVFYNSYLPEIVTEDKFDSVSAKGYAYGYVGSVILLLIILMIIQFAPQLGIQSETLPVRIGFLLVGLWWLGFASITFRILPGDIKKPMERSFIWKGMEEVKNVFDQVRKDSNIVKFLISYFFFIAGVNVVIYLATIFAQEELGFEQSNLIVLVLLLQFLAMFGAYLFAYISKKIGNKIALLIQLVIWLGISGVAYFVSNSTSFYILSIFVGLVFGGIQSLSRSTYSKMLSEDIQSLASYFSFYDVLTKVAVVAGTFAFGIVNQLTGNMRYSILSTGVFFCYWVFSASYTESQFQERNQLGKIISNTRSSLGLELMALSNSLLCQVALLE